MFWVDEIVEDITTKINKNDYLITDWKTPSGSIHVGALRGVIIHDLMRRALEDKGKKAKFQWGFDDFDPMDGLPVYIDKSWKQYMGNPLCDVPAPDRKHKSFAEQYANEFSKVFEQLGIKTKIVKSSDLYRSGKFNKAIKTVLDSAAKIRKIYKEISGSDKGDDWYPLQVICPKCGKIGTTIVTAWDGKEVEFECRKDLVEWAQGCGYSGKISPFSGSGKLPWKVEWPAKWAISKTDIEGEGKDHSAAGGSRDIANKIFRDIFSETPPYDIPYEFFLISGAKMSSSSGRGASAKDMAEFLPANILRFLFTRTRHKRAINFQPSGDTIPLLYDEFDRASIAYQKDPESDLGRAYYYSEIDTTTSSDKAKYLLRFSKIAYMLQMPRVDIFKYAEEEKTKKLSDAEKQEIENRIEIAKKWLEKFAPENYKFKIQEKLPKITSKLSKEQKMFLNKILDAIEEREWRGEDLHQKLHEIKKELTISPREAFSSIYLSFIGKDSGPQAGWLLASLDKEFVKERLSKVIK